MQENLMIIMRLLIAELVINAAIAWLVERRCAAEHWTCEMIECKASCPRTNLSTSAANHVSMTVQEGRRPSSGRCM